MVDITRLFCGSYGSLWLEPGFTAIVLRFALTLKLHKSKLLMEDDENGTASNKTSRIWNENCYFASPGHMTLHKVVSAAALF